MGIAGALFLTAGFGRRDEPLSLLRPKCLLPYGDRTILRRLAEQVRELDPCRILVNASRCPEEVLDELTMVWPEEACRLYFEERPLGSCATLARLSGEMQDGTWAVVNTDMVIRELGATGMLDHHYGSGADWTVLAGDFPDGGGYSPLMVDGDGQFGSDGGSRAHYWGISLMEPSIAGMAMEIQASEGLFSRLAPHAIAAGGKLRVYMQEGQWLDMGNIDLLRSNILSAGSYVHPTACLSSDVQLEGTWNIGKGCILGSGTCLRDSVMLQGSSLEEGKLEERILPWFCSSRDGGGS